MRLPVTPQISTKDGLSNKNARLTNCLKEATKRGDKAVVRPGLVLQAEGSGAGGGMVPFNSELVSVYGATLGRLTRSAGTYGSWTRVSSVMSFPLISAAYGNGVFLATDGHGMYRSAGGIAWATATIPFAGTWMLCSSGTNFIAADVETGVVYLSQDYGNSWSLKYTMLGVVLPLASIAAHFDGTYFLLGVCDDNEAAFIFRSSDGFSWAVAGSGIPTSGQITNMATGGGVTFAAMPTHDGWRSTDHGATWTAAGFDPNFICYGYGTFLGNSGSDVYGTPNGLSPSYLSTVPYGTLYGPIIFDGTRFIATSSGATSSYSTSLDGVTWTLQTDLSGAAGNIGQWNAQGTGGGTTVAGNSSSEILVLNGLTYSITSLGTVASGLYDFAQSPL